MENNHPYFVNNRGFVYIMLDDMEAASKDIEKSINLDPDNAWAFRNRGLLDLKQGDAEAAIRMLEKARGIESDVRYLDYYLGLAYLAADRRTEACEQFQILADRGEAKGTQALEQQCQ